MALPTQWTWVWARSGSWWWTGKPGVLQSLGLQRVPQDWAAKQQQGGDRLSNYIIGVMMESWGNASLWYLGSLPGVLVCLFHFGLTFILTLVWVPVLQEFAVPSFDVKKTMISLQLGPEALDGLVTKRPPSVPLHLSPSIFPSSAVYWSLPCAKKFVSF